MANGVNSPTTRTLKVHSRAPVGRGGNARKHSPLTKRTCVKPVFDREEATSLITATNVAGLRVTVPGKDP